MANTQHRSIRFPDDTWLPLMAAAREHGTSAGELCREFADWYLRKPGAKLPKRPDAPIAAAESALA
jgi:hypothetical protein